MSQKALQSICEIIQEDVGNRGLRTDPTTNLITATAGDYQAACRSIALAPNPVVAIVTGFYIPHAQPPCGETDGPLGALYLARALTPLGIRILLATDDFCIQALRAGLEACRLTTAVPLVSLPSTDQPGNEYRQLFAAKAGTGLTHLIALERVGPTHTPESMRTHTGTTRAALEVFGREVPDVHYDRCHTMRGRDITAAMSPAHLLFEARTAAITTIGIGDGGNEIGMGKVPWDVIRRNIPAGGLVACRVPTDHLIVSGVSNWGAYGLAAGVAILSGNKLSRGLFDIERERELLRIMVEQGPLVDGVTGQATVSVDGLDFERYAEALRRIGALMPN